MELFKNTSKSMIFYYFYMPFILYNLYCKHRVFYYQKNNNKPKGIIMTDVVGRFYFKLTVNSNLLGEYSSSTSKYSCTEAATRIYSGNNANEEAGFIGNYNSIWVEEDDDKSEYIMAKLEISAKQDCTNIFSLKWKVSGEDMFEGEAMLCDDILIGDYRSL